MRTAAIGSAKSPKGLQRSRTKTIPAPVGGWNTRDAIADMSPLDAVVLDNWFPETNDVRLRKGHSQHVTGITGQVESLMPYNKSDGTQTLFAAANSAFYNVTSSGAVGAAVQSSLSNIRWYEENFTNSSGTSYLTCFNGVDAPRYWDGSSWTSITGVSTPAITGVTTTSLIFPFAHKRRMFLIENDSLDLWYLPIDSVGGAANKLPLGGLATKGGYLMAGATWTIDGGAGIDDHLVVVTSEGQVIVYSGTNPASDYTLVGVWDVGEPIGRRCLLKYRGDLLIICKDGLWPLSKAMQSSQVAPEAALTFKINKSMTTSAVSYGSNFGWQTIFHPAANMLLLNIPVSEGSDQQQYAMNTITGAWGRFKDIEANCWANLNGEIYFGGNTFVGKFWDTEADNGEDIEGSITQAYSYLDAMGVLKKIESLRPNILADGTPTVSVGVNVDYAEGTLLPAVFNPTPYGQWDSGLWDTAVWGGSLTYFGEWANASGIGTAIAPRFRTRSQGIEVRYQSVDILFEIGTVIA